MPRVRNPVMTTLGLAKRYLKRVKNTVSPKKYQIFMCLIQETKDKRSDVGPTVRKVIRKVIELFKHNGGLLSGFNRFLAPKGYRIIPQMTPGQFQIRMTRSKKRSVDRLPTQNQEDYEWRGWLIAHTKRLQGFLCGLNWLRLKKQGDALDNQELRLVVVVVVVVCCWVVISMTISQGFYFLFLFLFRNPQGVFVMNDFDNDITRT